MTKQEILNQIEELKGLNKKFSPDVPNPELAKEVYRLEEEIAPHFYLIFDHYALRDAVKKIVEYGQDMTIGIVYSNSQDPVNIVQHVDRLKELDKSLMADEIHYLWHIESGHFDDGGICFQAYFCDAALYEEWQQAYDEACDVEYDLPRWIAPELTILSPFIKKHCHNANLIELWAGPY